MMTRRLSLIPLLLLSCIAALGQIPGAAADAIAVDDANMTVGQYTLTTTASTPFNCPGDVGKAIAVYGAGAQYPVWKNILGQRLPLALVTTIASCQKNNAVTLNAPAAFSVANVAMVFGTDDYAAVQSCVSAAANGGHCTFPASQSFMISNAGQNVTVPSGATIDGSGTIYYAPQGTITAMTNDTLFGVNEKWGTNITYAFHIAAPIRKGQTHFSAYNNSDIAASGAAVKRYVLVQDADPIYKGTTFVDWMRIKSIVLNDALAAGTYLSGITATGAAGQTCTLSRFNSSPGATATVALTGANTIAAGTSIFVTDSGTGARGPSSSARAGNGTAICSGTVAVSTKLGATVHTTRPFRMDFPGSNPWCAAGGPTLCSGLGWRTVLTPAHGIVIRDINIVVPPVASATRATRAFDIKGARGTLIENTHILQGGVLQDLEEEFNYGTRVVDNQWLSETGGINLAESVNEVYQGNTFDHQPTPWNGWQAPCASTIRGGHVDMELGLGWFKFIQNSLPHPCFVGITAFYGAHDGEIGANTIGWISGYASFSTKNVGIAGIGLKKTLIHDNTVAGADGAASIGLGLGDFSSGQPAIDSSDNVVWGNQIAGFAGSIYSFAGVLGTDCYYAQAAGVSASGAPCPQIFPFMMSPAVGSTLSGTSAVFSWSSAPGVSFYELCLGTAPGKCDLYQNMSPTALSMTATGLPNDGSPIYARLYFKIAGTWRFDSYTYIASDSDDAGPAAL